MLLFTMRCFDKLPMMFIILVSHMYVFEGVKKGKAFRYDKIMCLITVTSLWYYLFA